MEDHSERSKQNGLLTNHHDDNGEYVRLNLNRINSIDSIEEDDNDKYSKNELQYQMVRERNRKVMKTFLYGMGNSFKAVCIPILLVVLFVFTFEYNYHPISSNSQVEDSLLWNNSTTNNDNDFNPVANNIEFTDENDLLPLDGINMGISMNDDNMESNQTHQQKEEEDEQQQEQQQEEQQQLQQQEQQQEEEEQKQQEEQQYNESNDPENELHSEDTTGEESDEEEAEESDEVTANNDEFFPTANNIEFMKENGLTVPFEEINIGLSMNDDMESNQTHQQQEEEFNESNDPEYELHSEDAFGEESDEEESDDEESEESDGGRIRRRITGE